MWDAVDADCSVARVNRATRARAIAYWQKLTYPILNGSPLVGMLDTDDRVAVIRVTASPEGCRSI